MTGRQPVCADDRRRHEVRRQEWNGLDYLEVSDDQRHLTVYFLGPAPENLSRDNLRITGGRRIRDIRVTDVRVCEQVDQELDNCVVVTVDRPGDFSTYTLCLVDLPEDTRFDPRYRCLEFTFKAACPTELDCRPAAVCPPRTVQEPEISYLAKDYTSFRRLILDRLAVTVPEWTERHVPDLGITLVELLAYVGDHLSYHQDAVATEAYLGTARQRISVRRHARLVDYPMHDGCNARAWLHVRTSTDVTIPADEVAFLTGFDGVPEEPPTWADLAQVPPSRYEVFEPLDAGDELEFYQAHNEIRCYTWGDTECCLPRGATSATLVDGDRESGERVLHLSPGDVLVFEEVVGPRTGDRADADPAKRHAVRLTRAERVVDELYGQPLLEVEWSTSDALPFPLALSVIGPPPECVLLTDVSVARGNVLLVDHGRGLDPESLGRVPREAADVHCECEGQASDVVWRPGRFRPRLAAGPLTFSAPVKAGVPATLAIGQDPREALPWVRLTSNGTQPWTAVRDLLASAPDDHHHVVETDDAGRAQLRFGDGELGRLPEADHAFAARYRVGNGPAGNVGAGTIVVAVTRNRLSGVTLAPRNPLPAAGGTAPEPVAEVKLFAPHAFRKELARAVTADDYARLAERHPAVQRAAAELRWLGSWYEVRVAVDPLGRAEADASLLAEIERYLNRFRRIGHDVAVRQAAYVPLDLVLEVCVAEDFPRGHVKAALLDRFGTGPRGFFNPDALSFGQGISLSRLVAAAQTVPGVRSAAVTRLERLLEGPNGELARGVLAIGAMEVARLDSDPDFPEHGRIRFDLRGGR